jgi:hypothetical protein
MFERVLTRFFLALDGLRTRGFCRVGLVGADLSFAGGHGSGPQSSGEDCIQRPLVIFRTGGEVRTGFLGGMWDFL